MGSLSLNCPLCCGEEFTSYDSLKYHILSITDNLLCPACNNRFDSFLELAEHLGRECGPPEIEDVNIKPIRTFADVAIQSNLGPLETNANSNHGSDGSDSFLLRPKVELEEDNTEMNKSILAKALLGQQDDGRMDMPEGSMNPEEVQQTVYTCQMCNIDFHSIEEHLEKYHEGQEVLLEAKESHTRTFQQGIAQKNPSRNKFLQNRPCSVIKSDLPKTITEKYFLEDGEIRKLSYQTAKKLMKQKDMIEFFQCPVCHLNCRNLNDYKIHKCKAKFRCGQCRAVFLNYNTFKNHQATHVTTNIKPEVIFTCNLCNSGQVYLSARSLAFHKRTHNQEKGKNLSIKDDKSKQLERSPFAWKKNFKMIRSVNLTNIQPKN